MCSYREIGYTTTLGFFYREHSALHLGINSAFLPQLLARLSEYNIYLYSRLSMMREFDTKKRDNYEPVNETEIIKLSRGERLEKRILGFIDKTKNLRLIQVKRYGWIEPHENLNSYVDLYIHHYKNGQLYSNDDKPREINGYFSGAVYKTKSGISLPIVNLRYLYEIKKERFEKKMGETDAFDLAMITIYLKYG